VTDRDFKIRNYRASDFEACAALNLAAERESGHEHGSPYPDFAAWLHRPGASPENDILVAETEDKGLVAFLEMAPERNIARLILYCWVSPEYRRLGIARTFLERARLRGKQMGMRVLQASVNEKDARARQVVATLGFRPVRQFLEMGRDLADFAGSCPDVCRKIQPGEERELMDVQNRAFTGSWGFNPNTLEQITYHATAEESSPEDVMFCIAGGEVAGYCWTRVTMSADGTAKGRIFMLGVEPRFRWRGVGWQVLQAGMAYLKEKGVGEVVLTVDSENEVALNMYRKAGFSVTGKSLWYEQPVELAAS